MSKVLRGGKIDARRAGAKRASCRFACAGLKVRCGSGDRIRQGMLLPRRMVLSRTAVYEFHSDGAVRRSRISAGAPAPRQAQQGSRK